jgi:hypothetical protein
VDPSHRKVAGKVSVTLRQLQDGGFDEILGSPESMLFTTEILYMFPEKFLDAWSCHKNITLISAPSSTKTESGHLKQCQATTSVSS